MTEAEARRSPQEDLIEDVKRGLVQSPSVRLEFPITSMSMELANVIKLLAPPQDNHSIALDVGTGCGIHSFLLVRRGFKAVLAIDRNESAIELACERGNRLHIDSKSIDRGKVAEALLENSATEPRILLSAIPLQDLAELVETKFPLIVFNPPS